MTLWAGTACSGIRGSCCRFNDLSFFEDFLMHFQTHTTVLKATCNHSALLLIQFRSILFVPPPRLSAEQQSHVLGGGPPTPTAYSTMGGSRRGGLALRGNTARRHGQVCVPARVRRHSIFCFISCSGTHLAIMITFKAFVMYNRKLSVHHVDLNHYDC